jgi:hypothetical protein
MTLFGEEFARYNSHRSRLSGLCIDKIARHTDLFSDRPWCMPKINTYTGQFRRLDYFLKIKYNLILKLHISYMP